MDLFHEFSDRARKAMDSFGAFSDRTAYSFDPIISLYVDKKVIL